MNYIVVVNFNQSSYNVREGDGAVMIELIMSRPSLQPFEAVINPLDITTTGMLCLEIRSTCENT